MSDVHVKDLADVAVGIAFKNDDAVRAGAAGEARFIGLARSFAEDLDTLADELFIAWIGVRIHQREQVLIAALLLLLTDLNLIPELGKDDVIVQSYTLRPRAP